ncbi:MAG: CsbD family protein [Pyrinomonadaceae bacterium]|nr:CsbD family protein [Pyrinomonadaceae bacterium]
MSDGTAKEEMGGLKDRVVGNVKDAYGAVTGNTATEREGEAQNAMGNARQENNDVVGSNTSTSATGENRVLTGMFKDRESAESAYNSAINRGYTKDDVNVMMSDQTRDSWFSGDNADSELGSKALEGAGAGSAIGGTLGAIIAGIAAIGTSVLLPGVGLIVAGPLAAALAGAGAGGLTGGLVGALIGSGIPEDRAIAYEEGIKNGGMVVGVNPRNNEDADYFENEWRNNRGEHIYR